MGVKISNLPAVVTPAVSDIFPIVQAGVTYKETVTQLFSLLASTSGAPLTRTNDTNVTITLGGSPTTALVNAASLTMGWTGLLAVARGGTGVGSVTTAPTATAFAGWDANSNLSANNFLGGFATTVSAAGTTVLTVASAATQEITGSTTQTITLPVVSTLALGTTYKVINNSSGAVTVNSSGGNLVLTMAANTTAFFTSVLNTGTAAASWNSSYIFDQGGGVTSITGTANQITASASTGNVTLSLPATVRINTSILDTNSNTMLGFTAAATAINYFGFTNSATGTAVDFKALGGDTDVGLNIWTTGAGALQFITQAATNPITIYNGTGGQHTTTFQMANTAAGRTVVFPDATGTLLMTGQAINTVPSITFSSTTGIVGTTTNDSAAAGSVGEYIFSLVGNGSPVSVANGASGNVTSISLTAGDWDVWGNVTITTANTTMTQFYAYTTTASAAQPDVSVSSNLIIAAGGTIGSNTGLSVPFARYSLAGTTTVYLGATGAGASGNIAYCGGIYARRVR